MSVADPTRDRPERVLRTRRLSPGRPAIRSANALPVHLLSELKNNASQQSHNALLKPRLFVDLHQVLRESLRASVERYGLKEMEAFYRFTREVVLGGRASESARQLRHEHAAFQGF